MWRWPIGSESTFSLAFVHYPAGAFPNQTKALKDDTHFNAYGAYELARIVASGLREAKLDVAPFLTDDFAIFDPAQPDDANTLVLPLSPAHAAVGKPEGS